MTTNELNCRAYRSDIIHILKAPHIPGDPYHTVCGQHLLTGFHKFPLHMTVYFHRCKKCLLLENIDDE